MGNRKIMAAVTGQPPEGHALSLHHQIDGVEHGFFCTVDIRVCVACRDL